MDITIVTSAPEPAYEQIVRQIHDGVKAGRLAAGTPLPTVRQLAADLRLNRNTVARAYKMLEDQGVIETAGRKGSFVRQGAAVEVRKLKSGRAERSIHRMVTSLLSDGMSRKQIAELFNQALTLERRR
jgi:DNA-binding transcriptional regulator YhcF (GntR family)